MYRDTMKLNTRQRKRTGHLHLDPIPAKNLKTTAPDTLSPSPADAGLVSSHEEIATRAEALWRKKGSPQGCDEEIWLEAERQLGADLRLERDRIALADPGFDFNRNSNDLMEELNERFPGQTGKETTSL